MARSAGLALLLVGWCLSANADGEVSSAAVKRKAQEVGQAVVKGDYAKLVELTYPKVVETMGGRDKMIAAVETLMKQMKDQGYVMRSVVVGDPAEFMTEGPHTFVVVPTTVEMTAPGGKVVGKSYLLGISADGGKTWWFVDGSGLDTKEKRDKVLPKLPAKLKLPEKQKPEFRKDK